MQNYHTISSEFCRRIEEAGAKCVVRGEGIWNERQRVLSLYGCIYPNGLVRVLEWRADWHEYLGRVARKAEEKTFGSLQEFWNYLRNEIILPRPFETIPEVLRDLRRQRLLERLTHKNSLPILA